MKESESAYVCIIIIIIIIITLKHTIKWKNEMNFRRWNNLTMFRMMLFHIILPTRRHTYMWRFKVNNGLVCYIDDDDDRIFTMCVRGICVNGVKNPVSHEFILNAWRENQMINNLGGKASGAMEAQYILCITPSEFKRTHTHTQKYTSN